MSDQTGSPITPESMEAAVLKAAASGKYLGFAAWAQSIPHRESYILVAAAQRVRKEPGVVNVLSAVSKMAAMAPMVKAGQRVRVLRGDDQFRLTTHSGVAKKITENQVVVTLDDGTTTTCAAGTVCEMDVASLLGELFEGPA